MEVGELVAVKIPEFGEDDKCPFSHDKPTPEGKNELGGVGTKLAENLIGGVGISKSKPPTGPDFTKGQKVPDPRRRGTNPIKAVVIRVNGEVVKLKGRPLPYPVTCAAHHLLPAQEALKEHEVLEYMCKDGEDQDFLKSGESDSKPVSGAKVWGNVLYNVNGCQNGVWLPGNYAVGGGAGGVKVWTSKVSGNRDPDLNKQWADKLDMAEEDWEKSEDDPQENEKPQNLAQALAKSKLSAYALVGKNYDITNKNPKWAYVRAAMNAASGQFHDRHLDYSNKVKDYLDKVAKSYRLKFKDSVKGCDDCKKARLPANAKEGLVGPPYAIVGRLESCSGFFRGYVGTSMLISKVVYTSKWVQAYMDSGPKKGTKLED